MRRLFFVSSPGLERCLERELQTLRVPGQFERVPGGILVQGTSESLWRAVLQSRVAEFARICIGDPFHAPDTKALDASLRRLPWESCLWIRNGNFTVETPVVQIRVSSEKSRLYHTRMIEERVKAAIMTRQSMLPKVSGALTPSSEHTAPIVHVQLRHDACQVSVSASGPLHQRGYRESPLRETVAAASVLASPLLRRLTVAAHNNEELVVWDPFCSSGVLLLEALGVALGQPPRGQAKKYPFVGFPCHSEHDYAEFVSSIDPTPHPALSRLTLMGTDSSLVHVERARRNLARFSQQLWRRGTSDFGDEDQSRSIVGDAIADSKAEGVAPRSKNSGVDMACAPSNISFVQGNPAQIVRQLAGRPTMILTQVPCAADAEPSQRKRIGANSDILDAYGQLGRLLRQHKAEWRGAFCLAAGPEEDFRLRTGLEWAACELRALDGGCRWVQLLQWTGQAGDGAGGGTRSSHRSRGVRR